jgi:hypothetical protein
VYPLGKTILLTDAVDKVDWTAAGLGKNFIVSYGNPDATPEEIEKGDGKHVGTDFDAYNRITTVFATAAMRWPDLDWTPQPGDAGHSINTTFWSEGLQNRYGYSIALPPGYDLPESQGLTYPVVYFLPGHGMRSFDVILGGLLFNILASWGKFPKFILVVPEGQCCWIDMKTQTRYCWCWKNEDKEQWECAVPDCQGTHEECGVVAVNKGDLEQECNGGHFYANQKSNRWGDTDAAGLMRYEDMLDEMLDHVGKTYRVRPEGDALVPKRE